MLHIFKQLFNVFIEDGLVETVTDITYVLAQGLLKRNVSDNSEYCLIKLFSSSFMDCFTIGFPNAGKNDIFVFNLLLETVTGRDLTIQLFVHFNYKKYQNLEDFNFTNAGIN